MNFEEHEIEWTDEKIGRLWTFYQSPAMAEMYFGFRNGGHISAVLRKYLKQHSVKRVLDMSCGKGDIIGACLPRLSKGQQIFGTDLTDASVDYVNSRFASEERFGGAFVVNSFRTPFKDGEMDLIISTEVIEHLDDGAVSEMLTEMNRTLSPGGYLFITTPNQENLDHNKVMCPDCGCKFHRWQHRRSWSSESLSKATADFGFNTVMSKTLAWGDGRLRRTIFPLATFLRLKEKTGLVYVGQKVA